MCLYINRPHSSPEMRPRNEWTFLPASSGPRSAQHPASLPSTTTLGRLRTPRLFARAEMFGFAEHQVLEEVR